MGVQAGGRQTGHGIYILLFTGWPHFLLLQPVYTDAYLYDEGSLRDIERFREDIFTIIETKPLMPPKWELVLDMGESQQLNERICYYYFINAANRSLFWLEDFDVTPILRGFGKAISMPHICESGFPPPSGISTADECQKIRRYRVAIGRSTPYGSVYGLTVTRSHWEMFPHNRDVPEELLRELIGIMVHAGIGES